MTKGRNKTRLVLRTAAPENSIEDCSFLALSAIALASATTSLIHTIRLGSVPVCEVMHTVQCMGKHGKHLMRDTWYVQSYTARSSSRAEWQWAYLIVFEAQQGARSQLQQPTLRSKGYVTIGYTPKH